MPLGAVLNEENGVAAGALAVHFRRSDVAIVMPFSEQLKSVVVVGHGHFREVLDIGAALGVLAQLQTGAVLEKIINMFIVYL